MLGVPGTGHQEPADWTAFIKRDLDGIVSVRAIKGVTESKIQKHQQLYVSSTEASDGKS